MACFSHQATVAVTPTIQTIATPKQTPVVISSGQVINTEGQIVNSVNPILINNANVNTVNVLQNLVNGKAALTTINGQQVIIRSAGGKLQHNIPYYIKIDLDVFKIDFSTSL